jgi:hypothetical protein
MMNNKPTDMEQLKALQEYLEGLYEAYDVFQTDYRNCHKRSRMHDTEPVAEYYLRWRDKMRIEIRRIEALLLRQLPAPCRPCIKPELKTENGGLTVEKYQLQIVANSAVLAFTY